MVLLGQTKSTMSTTTDNGIVILIEDHEGVGQNIKYGLTKEGYEVVWIKDIKMLKKVTILLKGWGKERLELVRAVIFDFYLDEKCEHWTLDMVPEFLECDPSKEWVLLANSPFDDLNELLVRKGCTHARPSRTRKKYISQYLLQVLHERL